MKTSGWFLHLVLLAGCAVICAPELRAATVLTGDYTIAADPGASPVESGDLTVEGELYIEGNFMDFGSTNETIPMAAVEYSYLDNGTEYQLATTASRDVGSYLWQESGASTVKSKMELDSSNTLTLFAPNYNPANTNVGRIALVPAVSGSSLSIDGSPVLTISIGDGRYLQQTAAETFLSVSDAAQQYVRSSLISATEVTQYDETGPAVSSQGASAAGYYSFAYGFDARAGAYSSTAIGYMAVANADYATAFGGWTTASGMFSTAFGENSIASGVHSTAFGEYSIASGSNSTAFGLSAMASGDSSIAMGERVGAVGFGQLAVGLYSIPQGDPDEWVETDDLFIMGNGRPDVYDEYGELITPGYFSNAFVVRKNADTRVGGRMDVKGGVRVPPQGDLSMGEFTAGQNPADLDGTTGLRYQGE